MMECCYSLILLLLRLVIWCYIISTSHNIDMSLMRFGYGFSTNSSRTIFGIPIRDCRMECTSRSACKAFNYNRRVHFCTLYSVDSTGMPLNTNSKYVTEEKRLWTEQFLSPACNCGDHEVCRSDGSTYTCEIEECNGTHTIGSRSIFGNMNKVGSRAMCTCQCYKMSTGMATHSDLQYTCTTGGTWSMAQGECFETYESFIVAMGCYLDRWDRILSHAVSGVPDMTIERCGVHCFRLNYIYFGIEKGRECFCGNSINYHGLSNGCTFPCEGDSSLTCGGHWSLQLYNYTNV